MNMTTFSKNAVPHEWFQFKIECQVRLGMENGRFGMNAVTAIETFTSIGMTVVCDFN